jgi:pyridoxamine 5'-phosphate oxidase
MAQKFEGRDVPRPDFWSGFRLLPQRMEFWQEKPFRLHDRRLYMRVEDGWQVSLLYP